jgi:hypothetical protein
MGYLRQVTDHRAEKRRKYSHEDSYWAEESGRRSSEFGSRTRLDRRDQRKRDGRHVNSNLLYER